MRVPLLFYVHSTHNNGEVVRFMPNENLRNKDLHSGDSDGSDSSHISSGLVSDTDKLMISCAFTGHRPARFAFGFNESDERCIKLNALLREQIEALIVKGVTWFYTGMALGVDQWAADIVLELKQTHPKLKLIAVRPCETQADNWTVAQHERHFATLALCDDVFTIQPRYSQGVMHKRNRFLVDHAECLVAVYDGGADGGTAYTVRYAKEQERSITVIHPDTLEVTQL